MAVYAITVTVTVVQSSYEDVSYNPLTADRARELATLFFWQVSWRKTFAYDDILL